MNESVLEQRELMIKLQALEKKTIELDKVIVKVEEEVEVLDKKVLAEEEKFKSFENDLKEKKKLYVMYENDLESNIQRIDKYEQHLKKLTSPKDYRALQREVDETKKLNEEIQETMLNLMEETEELENRIKEKDASLKQLKVQAESEKEEIIKKAENESQEKADLEKNKDEISRSLDQKNKDIYYDTLKKSGGIAIVPITNQVCNGCFLRIPPQVQIEIKKGNELIFCPRCHRIVYLEEDRPI
jgi:predicted  nucleic acid-binding Zn-ribbon protein